MINKDGAYIGAMDFTFEPETEVFHSCSLTYLDEVFIFGGSLQPKQISVSCPRAEFKLYYKKFEPLSCQESFLVVLS